MLKYRLLYGILMTVVFTAIVIFDGWLDGSLTASAADDKTVQGTILYILIAGLIIPAQLELSKLAKAKNLRIFTPAAIIASVLFAGSWYWRQLIEIRPLIYLFFLSAFSLWALLLYQYFRFGTSGVIANCGAGYFSIIYLGLFSAFVVGIRIDFGLWGLLMFIFVVKFADIGAYAIGVLFGKHKFSPNISPGKTWEGMGGAVSAAIIVSFLFGAGCDIMSWCSAVIFGIFIAFTGQVGDLVESMMKRDAETKDSSNKVPGFGGILDIIDSPLFSAPFAYLFFTFAVGK
ncbi:MAG: phosphatidate cytidylyltransferase [Phycisphaerae bacterium]|nr:phosphatidate cytidylyltransferase [Phycisphaerae bacterium]